MTNTDAKERYPVFRQSMRVLHTWIGLVPSWILYFMFITGTVGYFQIEITEWMKPEIPYAGEQTSQANMLQMAEKRLHKIAGHADEWYIRFPDNRNGHLRIYWEKNFSQLEKEQFESEGLSNEAIEEKAKALRGNEKLHLETGQPVQYANGAKEERNTGGGRVLYRMHYVLHYLPTSFAEYLVIFCTLFMLVALITGIVIHKRIFKNFFTFQPGKKQRSWLDAHNVFSVFSLPFQFMITYSGLLFFLSTIMPILYFGPVALMGFDIANATAAKSVDDLSPKNRALFEIVQSEVLNQPQAESPLGEFAPLMPLLPLLENVKTQRPKEPASYIKVENAHDVNARVLVRLPDGVSDGDNSFVFNGVSGQPIYKNNNEEDNNFSNSVARHTDEVMRNLHEGRFAPSILRWLYFISGLMGAGMIATGSILWAVKRREKAEKKGHIGKGLLLVESLNIGTIVGLLVAVAAYFWANRLIPAEFEGRADWEVHVLFITWGLMFLHTLCRPRETVWKEQLWLAAFAYGLIPLLNVFTSERHLGVSLFQGDWVMAGFDLTMLAFGVLFALAARRKPKKQESKRTELSNNIDPVVIKPNSIEVTKA